MSQSKDAFTVGNGLVTLVFPRQGGKITSLLWRGQELLAAGGAYIQVALQSNHDHVPLRWESSVVRRAPGLVEIRVANTDPRCPFDLEAHYVVRAGEPGFHNYLVWGHDAARCPGVHELAQYNFCLRADPRRFTTAAVDAERTTPFPLPSLLRREQLVMDATYRLPDGTDYSKYFFSAAMDERHLLHGMLGDGLGLWLIMPSHEHLNGGPEHQELTVHQTDSSPVLLAHATAAHYGAGVIRSDSRNGSWSKVSAPWFVYVNEGQSPAELWRDARRQAAAAVAAWPYAWLADPRFELRRGRVQGRLRFDDGQPAGTARVILAPHQESPSPDDWQRQWEGYRFYGYTDAEGRFDLPHVRPGRYDLYAWKSGVLGTFVRRAVDVQADAACEVGELTWNLPRDRSLLWQIGVPDRSAGEFGLAEHFRQWGLWDRIAAANPHGVDFTVGKGRDRDLPFILAVTQDRDLAWREPQWRIQFDDPGGRGGRAMLTLAIATADGAHGASLRLALNEQPLARIDDLPTSGAVHRSGLWGTWQLREVTFDAARIRSGTNRLTLSLAAPSRRATQPLGFPAGGAILPDCIRLEVDHPPAKR